MTPFTFDDEMHLLEHGYEYTPGTGWSEERKDKLDRAKTLFIESLLMIEPLKLTVFNPPGRNKSAYSTVFDGPSRLLIN